MKILEKKKAIELRKQGFSYKEIRERITVSKSTLSLWLRSVGLAKRFIRRLSEKQRMSQQRAVALWKQRRIDKTFKIKHEAQAEIKYLNDRERWLIGIALYWAEGTKERDYPTRVIFCNSDPGMILFFREWILDFLKVPPYDLTYVLCIHQKAKNIAGAIRFWADLLDIDIADIHITLKKHNPSPKRKNIDVNYKGLMRLVVRKSIDMNRKISGWIDGILKA